MVSRDSTPGAAAPATDKMAGERGAADAGADDTFVLTLEHGEHLDSTLYRFDKGCYLEFCPGPSLLGRKVFLYTNYVVDDDQDEKGEQAEFVRSQYYGLEWRERGDDGGAGRALGAGALVSAADVYCRLRLRRAGSFHYYYVYDDAESPVGPQGSGWFGVAPTLRVGAGGRERVPLDGLACQTVVAKCLGPLARWESVLRVSKEAGYNMVHFTPVQRLGASGSGYSLADRLSLDPMFGDGGFAAVESLVTKMRTEWKVLSICDVVLNHTANETEWLESHPEASYNCANCPHLRPAALLDALLARLSAAVARGEHEARGIPRRIERHEQLEALERLLAAQLVPEARLHELFTCDAAALAAEWTRLARARLPAPQPAADELRLAPDPQRRRLRASVDLEAALRVFNVHRADCADEDERLRRCADDFRRRLEQLNDAAADEARDHLRAAVRNVVAGARYTRLQADGPREHDVSDRHPLAPRYFTWASDVESMSLAEIESEVYGAGGGRVRAHNGWVMGGDPLVDFAARDQDGRVYLRRELIAWSDSVKLRYGAAPEDSPFLWAHMREYVELTAELFDGLRLDNCHSTPLHVAEHMLDAARNVKPELYALAELFTDSAHVDNIFVNRLGLTALVREAQAAGDARELGRLVHRYGGRAVGSLAGAAPGARPAPPQVAPALLMDLTHDNPAALARRSAHDLAPTAALVAAAGCGAGSTRGYDELVPHAVDVVAEARLYAAWADEAAPGAVCARSGLLAARRALNELHAALAAEGYCELFVDQLDADVVAVTRHNPLTRKSVIVVAFTAFTAPGADGGARPVPPLRVEGRLEDVLLEISTRVDAAPPFARHPAYINGLDGVAVSVRRAPPPADCALAAVHDDGALTELRWRALAPGAVLAVRVAPRPAAAAALRRLAAPPPLAPALVPLDLADFNALLYRCDAEEREAAGQGVYDVPGWGPLPYAGLQGAASLLADVVAADDLAHPLCANLRAGDWLADYTCARAERDPRLAAVGAVLRAALEPLADLPRFLVPCHAARALLALHAEVARAALARLRGPAVRGGGPLARALALTSVQLVGAVSSAPLPAPSPALPPPRPPRGSLSAGLPHFATGHMRCWGRDTFVALPGLLLLTGRYEESRAHILAFAACLRHGLVPNLLAGGEAARYNCRDAVWWWAHAVRRHVELAPGGAALLGEPVARLFPTDEAEGAPAVDQPLHDVLQEALDVHFQGRVFRERRAGRDIDAHMADRGFTVQLGVDPDTGFPFGGNDANCGTWMDKMGSSERAGTRGQPATPRDGSAVELVALAYSAVSFLAAQHRAGRHPYPGVVRRHRDGALTSWTYAQWAERIRRNFERHFWVPAEPAAHEPRPDLVHRRAIYKDSHGASRPWADYQLRCNFSVAMAIAPELFEPRHAALALDAVERLLAGPLGLKTLDPADWAYRPNYDPADDSADPSVAHGFNYHQGPEWTWPLPFYLRARLAFAREPRAVAAVTAALGPLLREIRTSPWRGLPELTDAGGAACAHACRTQAWSSGAALELLHELRLRAPPAAD